MDIDVVDLLNTNNFIKTPELEKNVKLEKEEEFRKFYKKELEKQNETKILESLDLKNLIVDESHDKNNLLTTNKVNFSKSENDNVLRSTREVKTLISVDSRDRDELLYPKPNDFKIFLNKTFLNVRSVKLVSLEFPNTNAVINSLNRNLYWRNKEDINLDFTLNNNNKLEYPVYTNQLRIGSYIASSLQTEITGKLNVIRRKQGQSNSNSIIGDYHYFVTSLNIETDIVTFISLNLKQLSNNPISTTADSGTIRMFVTSHGYLTNDNIYLVDCKALAGIEADLLNGFHIITVINSNIFTFEVNVKASQTIGDSTKGGGGGNIVKSGTQAPFQLLWGQEDFTVAQNIGFPLENSSQIMYTNINIPFENIFQMNITTSTIHKLSRDFTVLGQTIKIGSIVNNIFVESYSFTITDISTTTSITVQVIDNTIRDTLSGSDEFPLSSTNYIQFGTQIPINVYIYDKYTTQSFLVTTTTPHGYNFSDINTTILSIYNTVDPSVTNDNNYDGNYYISQIIDVNKIILPGILLNTNLHNNGIYGQIPKLNPLNTFTATISNIIPNFTLIGDLYYTKITCTIPHKLKINTLDSKLNDYVYFYNVVSAPTFINSIKVSSIIDTYSFLIQFNMSSVNMTNITKRLSYIGTGLITVDFPSHGFNSITSITQHNVGEALVQTTTDHNLVAGNIIRISNTDARSSTNNPSMDDAYNIISIENNDTFVISRLNGKGIITISTIGTTGLIGLSNEFRLYNATSLGGIPSTILNRYPYTVREILDSNTFTFVIPSIFSNSTEIGGGYNLYISSLYHGFSGVQTNTKNNILNRSINLEGENYTFITCPQLSTMKNTGNVKDVFARIILDQAPGYVCFNYLSNPKVFDTVPLSQLSELQFSIVNYDTSLYEFSDINYSFTLEITEILDTTDLFNHSSKRGIVDTK
jgi:hypothetical protein